MDFEYEPVTLSAETVDPAGTIEASVTVENIGDRAGHEVIQCYVHQAWPSQARPVEELVGFQRVFLEPGESTTVHFEVATVQLAFHDDDMDLVVEPDEYELRIGSSAATIETSDTFEIVGQRYEVPRSGRIYAAETRVED